jgi:gas vesicle protein
MSSGRFLGGLVVGSLVGAVVALLVTPKTGRETRQWLAEEGNCKWGEIEGEVHTQLDGLRNKFGEAGGVSREKAAETVEQLREAFQKVAGSIDEGVRTAISKVQHKVGSVNPDDSQN